VLSGNAPGRRRRALLAFGGAILLAAPGRAQRFPERPLRLVVPFAPGGSSDLAARLIAEPMAERLGQPVVVENRAGAGGSLGAEAVARAAPDGHTMLMGAPGALVINPHLTPNFAFDPRRDLAPVSLVFVTDHALVVNPAVPARTLAEFIALAKAQPGRVSYASSGPGTTLHLFGELFRQQAGVDITHVPYRGNAPAMTDLLAGTVQSMFDQLVISGPHIQTGRLRALVVTGPQRNTRFPEIPTAAESGLPEFVATSWNALLVPAGTPPFAIARLNEAVAAALAVPLVRERLAATGAEPTPSSAGALGTLLARENDRWGRVVREARIVVN
jgi:tripartite-type tricarboxylate transporter receptor subunit TctC